MLFRMTVLIYTSIGKVQVGLRLWCVVVLGYGQSDGLQGSCAGLSLAVYGGLSGGLSQSVIERRLEFEASGLLRRGSRKPSAR